MNKLIYLFLLAIVSCQTFAPNNFTFVRRDGYGNIIELFGSDESLNSLSFLDNYPNLITLEFIDSGIDDYTPIERLQHLRTLTIDHFKYYSINFMKKLKNVECFTLYDGIRIDLTPLLSIDKLNELELNDCDILSIYPLKYLIYLKSLQLDSCKGVSDLKPLEHLSQLETLKITHCNDLVDIQPIGYLTNLKYLDLNSCPNVTDISGLANCVNLEVLYLPDAKHLTGIEVLKNMPKLRELSDFSERDGFEIAKYRPELVRSYFSKQQNE